MILKKVLCVPFCLLDSKNIWFSQYLSFMTTLLEQFSRTLSNSCLHILAFIPKFFQGWGAQSTVVQISFVMLIFIFFRPNFKGGQTSLGGELLQEGALCPPLDESQRIVQLVYYQIT